MTAPFDALILAAAGGARVGHATLDAIEDSLLSSPRYEMVDQPLRHTFVPGLYIREIFNRRGSIVTTETHRFDHPFFMLRGKLMVATADGERYDLAAPTQGITRAGTRRLLYAIEDTVFVTVHPNPDNETDLDKLRERLVEPARVLGGGETANQRFFEKLAAQRALEGGFS